MDGRDRVDGWCGRMVCSMSESWWVGGNRIDGVGMWYIQGMSHSG